VLSSSSLELEEEEDEEDEEEDDARSSRLERLVLRELARLKADAVTLEELLAPALGTADNDDVRWPWPL